MAGVLLSSDPRKAIATDDGARCCARRVLDRDRFEAAEVVPQRRSASSSARDSTSCVSELDASPASALPRSELAHSNSLHHLSLKRAKANDTSNLQLRCSLLEHRVLITSALRSACVLFFFLLRAGNSRPGTRSALRNLARSSHFSYIKHCAKGDLVWRETLEPCQRLSRSALRL